ncbi:methionyl-tRNA formyltransferase [candidate division KSB1 bacterium]|nr:methionyl-tRNA formyltransferase [candidate division KSB1 bacterium]
MNIVYMGTPEFACAPLTALHNSEHKIAAVVTGPDKPAGRGKNLRPTAVKQQAEQFGLPVLTPESLKSEEFYQELKEIAPDLIVIVAFRILPERIFSLPKFGSLNIHGSILPKYRGAAPIQWALINGEKETGLSSFLLKSKVDTGDIILQQKTNIDDNENFDSLYNRLSEMAGPFLLDSIKKIESKDFKPVSQDESLSTPAPKLKSSDALIDFEKSAVKVHNLIRGLATRPGAFTFFRGKKVKVYSSRLSDKTPENSAQPGSILSDKSELLVQCDESVLELTQLLPEGKKVMDGRSFINGYRPESGESFD